MATEGAPVMMLFVDGVVRIAYGDGAETQLPQAAIEHSKLLQDMQVRKYTGVEYGTNGFALHYRTASERLQPLNTTGCTKRHGHARCASPAQSHKANHQTPTPLP